MEKKLKTGETFFFDEEDLELISKYSWYLDEDGYVVATSKRADHPERKQTRIRLHRLVMGVYDKTIQVDHKNLDKLDNRKENLRICNNSQNQANIDAHSRNKSGLKGVRLKFGKYEAYIWNNKSIYLGRFATAEEAGQAYDEAAIRIFGEFARLNYRKN